MITLKSAELFRFEHWAWIPFRYGIATMTEVVQERAAAGVGVLFSSHQLDLVEDICEDVVIIARGRVVAAGPIEALKAAADLLHGVKVTANTTDDKPAAKPDDKASAKPDAAKPATKPN